MDLPTPEISVIIPCKGHAAELWDCLHGLIKMVVDVPYEIIVVDSASDPEVLAASQDFGDVRILRSEDNLSSGPARNLGVVQARSDFLAFIDADCIPDVGWLQAAHRALLDGAQMVGGPVLDALPDEPISVVDNLLQFADLSPGRPKGLVEVLPACNLAVRREAFDTIHGFPDIVLNQDSLFTDKVASLWPEDCWFVPGMVVAHKGRNTLRELYQHHSGFGYYRGLFGFRVTEFQQKAARFGVFIPALALKRLVYIFKQVFIWERDQIIRYVRLLPLILFGLWGWAVGFRRGCRDALQERQK